MSPSLEREAQTQADRLHAAGQMTPAEIVTLQDDLAWWKDHSAKLSAYNHKLATHVLGVREMLANMPSTDNP